MKVRRANVLDISQLVLAILLFAGVCQAQNISAARMPMRFGTIRSESTAKPLTGSEGEITRSDSISYTNMICPRCGKHMSQIYIDTVSAGPRDFKAIRILQCQGGNKVLLSFPVNESTFYRNRGLLISTKK